MTSKQKHYAAGLGAAGLLVWAAIHFMRGSSVEVPDITHRSPTKGNGERIPATLPALSPSEDADLHTGRQPLAGTEWVGLPDFILKRSQVPLIDFDSGVFTPAFKEGLALSDAEVVEVHACFLKFHEVFARLERSAASVVQEEGGSIVRLLPIQEELRKPGLAFKQDLLALLGKGRGEAAALLLLQASREEGAAQIDLSLEVLGTDGPIYLHERVYAPDGGVASDRDRAAVSSGREFAGFWRWSHLQPLLTGPLK